jgi:hypothetical protein
MSRIFSSNLKLFFVSFSFLLIFSFVESVFAQEEGLSLKVSPPLLEIDIQPGETYTHYVKFMNLSETEERTFYPELSSFKSLGEGGTPEFFTSVETQDRPYSLSQWINVSLEPITIGPLETVTLPFTISVPENAEVGGKYASILLSSQPSDAVLEDTAVELSGKTGLIILAQVPGDIYGSAFITDFKTSKKVFNYLPVDFEMMIENRGNTHVKPVGKIEISNIFGKIIAEIPVNESLGSVLPESRRKFSSEWDSEEFALGRYSAVLALGYGEDSMQYITDSLTFWVLPWKEISIALGVLVTIIIVLIFLVKSYNRRLYKKAMEIGRNDSRSKYIP